MAGFWSLRADGAEIVLEMAVQTLILNIDRCTKNHLYLLRPDGRMMVVPTDLEDAFATDDRNGYRDCSAKRAICDPFCYLSCDAYNSPYMCDRLHPQDPQLDKVRPAAWIWRRRRRRRRRRR